MEKKSILYIKILYNNLFFTLTEKGKVIKTISLGKLKLKKNVLKNIGSLKKLMLNITKIIRYLSIKKFSIKIKGWSPHLKLMLFILRKKRFKVTKLSYKLAFPFNGCKNKKLRRI